MHRECLDRWRATREDRAFSQCTECFFAYEYVARDESGEDKGLFFDGGPLTPQRRRRLKFQMFVARDFLAVFVVMQICVLFLAAVVRKIDCGKFKDCAGSLFDELLESNETEWSEGAPYTQDSASQCCPEGFIINQIPPFTVMTHHTQSAYYLVGMLLFFAIIGCVGCCNKRVPGAQCCSDTGDCDCCNCGTWYWWYSPSDSCDCCCCCGGGGGGGHSVDYSSSGTGGGGGGGGCGGCCDDCDCDGDDCKPSCNGGGGGDDAGAIVAVLVVIVVAVVVIFAVIGVRPAPAQSFASF